jgi:biotin transport system ATP-binding protein
MTFDPPLIDLRQVSYAAQGKTILSDITLNTRARRIGFVGRNGSGKTTLARLLAGLVPPEAGHLEIDGIQVAKDRKAALGRVGILFQNPDHQIIFPTVEEEIGFGLAQMKRPRERIAQEVAAILDRFGKGHWAKAAIHQLSQGQRQLVCLMAVLVMEPRLVILDEPFAGLDIPTTRQLQRVLDGLEQTIVMITHDPRMVEDYEHLVWLDEGRIQRQGDAAPVLSAFTERMLQIGEGDDLADLAG